METASQVQEEIIKLNPENVKIGGYYKTTWMRPEAPHCACPIRMDKYDESTRLFHFTVLTDNRELSTHSDYPLIQISEKEAGELLDYIRQNVRNRAFTQQPETQKPKQVNMTTETAVAIASESDNHLSTETPVVSTSKRGRKPAGVPTLSSVARSILSSGGTQDEARKAILAQFPDANPSSVNSTIYITKSKLAKEQA